MSLGIVVLKKLFMRMQMPTLWSDDKKFSDLCKSCYNWLQQKSKQNIFLNNKWCTLPYYLHSDYFTQVKELLNFTQQNCDVTRGSFDKYTKAFHGTTYN